MCFDVTHQIRICSFSTPKLHWGAHLACKNKLWRGFMPKHIVRLLILIAVVATVAFSAKRFLRADSFYQYGHYRGNAVAEIASKVPKLQGSASCQSCHKEAYDRMDSRHPSKSHQKRRSSGSGLLNMVRVVKFVTLVRQAITPPKNPCRFPSRIR